MKKQVFFLLFFTFCLFQGYAQRFNFSNYSINEGLSQSVVNATFQDSRGYLWIGTQNGLNRFDGETFEIYTFDPSDSGSISNNWIYAITEDHEGNLWVGTKGGLNKFLFAQNRFQRINYQANYVYDVTRYCYDVICLNNGKILVNTPPVVSVYDIQNESFEHYLSDLPYDGAVNDVKLPALEDSDGTVWIGSTTGLARLSHESKAFQYYTLYDTHGKVVENTGITTLYRDRNNTMWCGTSAGLFRHEPESQRFNRVKCTKGTQGSELLERCVVRSILDDKNGNLYIGTQRNGLLALSATSPEDEPVRMYSSVNSSIGHNIVQTLLIDKSENLWAGTLQGLSKTDLKKGKFKLYRNDNSPHAVNLLDNVIASIYKDDKGMLWAGNWGQGLNLINPENNTVEHFSSQLKGNHFIPNDFVHEIFQDNKGRMWLGTRDGILIYDRSGNRFLPWKSYFNNPELPDLQNVRIFMIIQDKNQNYWIATQYGLYKVNLERNEIEIFQQERETRHQISGNSVYCLLEDSEGLIWIATVNGLDRYDPANGDITHFGGEDGLSGDLIISLAEDRQGRIWIGTSTYLNIYDKSDSTFTFYGQAHGLPNNNIFEIVRDHNNGMWLATGKGLCRYNEPQDRFDTYTLEDGIQSLEFNLRAAHVSRDGEIFMGGMNGFNSFFPDSLAKNTYMPDLVFTSFYISRGSSREYILPDKDNEIILNHNDHAFTIEFAALEYTNPTKNNYAYRMEGVSPEWISIGNRKFVPFSALKPGYYKFWVKGSNNDDVWNDEPIGIQIRVLPPWWKSKSALFGYVLLIFLGVIFFVKMWERKLLKDKKVLEQRILERTLQIEEQNRLITSKNLELNELNRTKDKLFTIIGHDLGNQFNIIVGFLELLVSDFKKLTSSKVEQHINNIHATAVRAYDLLENLLMWSKMQTRSMGFNPEPLKVYDSISKEIQLLQNSYLEKSISVELNVKDGITLWADANMFSTICRNTLYNAIKFTEKGGVIKVYAEENDHEVIVSIKDNGIGIPEENIPRLFILEGNLSTKGTEGEKGTGLGLILVKEFVDKHKGRIQVISEPGKGSEFIYSFPVKTNET